MFVEDDGKNDMHLQKIPAQNGTKVLSRFERGEDKYGLILMDPRLNNELFNHPLRRAFQALRGIETPKTFVYLIGVSIIDIQVPEMDGYEEAQGNRPPKSDKRKVSRLAP